MTDKPDTDGSRKVIRRKRIRGLVGNLTGDALVEIASKIGTKKGDGRLPSQDEIEERAGIKELRDRAKPKDEH